MDYDLSVFPPAPRLEVRFIALPHGADFDPVSAFLDTEADATIVPLGIIWQLKAGVVTFKMVRGYTGGQRSVRIYLGNCSGAGRFQPVLRPFWPLRVPLNAETQVPGTNGSPKRTR